MAGTAKGKRRMGWIGWTVLGLVLLGAVGVYTFRRALENNAVAVLDSADKLLNGGDGAMRQVADLRYGNDPAQKLEMFVPQGATGSLPVLVFVHGGSWAGGDPHDYRFIARTFCAKGYAVVLAGYRLYPRARFPAMVQDGAAAVRWVHDNAAKLGGDPARVALMGHSAGAYNVAMLTLDPQWLRAVGLDDTAIRGTVALAGPFDFLPLDSDATINAFGNAPDPLKTQPVNFVRKDAPPMLLVTGDADTRVKPRNSKRLAQLLTQAGAPNQPVLIEGVTHEKIIMMFAQPFARDSRAIDAVVPFLDRVTAPSVAVQAAGG
ncbi:alpha/beta hydrolase [Novosphingobium sp. 17-62-19]|uniref:alpha/beta hydrolase n=1 Tax=Novosphingobium sp. 17-62-19 TaxID=1970406 RepID=UPI0025CE4243|nr:alpha/beta hydrolase [Novosphingobium sp. 17-62-19]HQS94961.1 alpha/beta hydrolase [Novosphingobium sp.]